jgi:transposase InsO family protein
LFDVGGGEDGGHHRKQVGTGGEAYTGVLNAHQVRISMDNKGRAIDNIFVERLWRSVKYEEVYPKHLLIEHRQKFMVT